ncbi:MAG: D-aminoacyl-tRNA deacylase [Planctomycetota bacterium]|nr:D-aminoacyl-tRNA deacylase [Planctomycetota bacterium]
MRAVLQRVTKAKVTVDSSVVGEIDGGLLVLLGVGQDDSQEEALVLARKLAQLRIFRDNEGKMNLSLIDSGGSVLVVSQFTLFGDCRKGRRPSFNKAARPEQAIPLYEFFCQTLREMGLNVETGRFGAMMDVNLVNDGPVTILLDTDELSAPRK